MKTALVVIDVQKGFAVEKASNLPEKIVEHLKNNKYDYALFTISHNNPGSNFRNILNWEGGSETPFIDPHPLIEPLLTSHNTFHKTTYSAFKATGLLEYIERNNVKKIYLCGINTDACVLASAFDAFDLGYDFEIIDELSSASSPRQDYVDAANIIIKRNLRKK
jgi:nicotinamidase-related amidase